MNIEKIFQAIFCEFGVGVLKDLEAGNWPDIDKYDFWASTEFEGVRIEINRELKSLPMLILTRRFRKTELYTPIAYFIENLEQIEILFLSDSVFELNPGSVFFYISKICKRIAELSG